MNALTYLNTVLGRINANKECSIHRALLILNLVRAGESGMTIPELAKNVGMVECSVSQAICGLWESTGMSIKKKRFYRLNSKGRELADSLFKMERILK